MTRTFAAAQTIPIPGDVEANVAEHVRLAETASDENAAVVVFPELSLTGYELHLAHELAFSINDARLDPLLRVAKASRLTIVAGAPVRLAARLHIGAFIISSDGAIDVYTKHHLGAFAAEDNPGGSVPPPESTVFQPGDRNPIVRIGSTAAAVAVCADVGRPVHAEAAAARGAQAYLASMFVIPSDLEKDLTRLRTYAQLHSMTVVFANYGGASGGLPSGGCSGIWAAGGQLLVQLDPAGCGLAIASDEVGARSGRAIKMGGTPRPASRSEAHANGLS